MVQFRDGNERKSLTRSIWQPAFCANTMLMFAKLSLSTAEKEQLIPITESNRYQPYHYHQTFILVFAFLWYEQYITVSNAFSQFLQHKIKIYIFSYLPVATITSTLEAKFFSSCWARYPTAPWAPLATCSSPHQIPVLHPAIWMTLYTHTLPPDHCAHPMKSMKPVFHCGELFMDSIKPHSVSHNKDATEG